MYEVRSFIRTYEHTFALTNTLRAVHELVPGTSYMYVSTYVLTVRMYVLTCRAVRSVSAPSNLQHQPRATRHTLHPRPTTGIIS